MNQQKPLGQKEMAAYLSTSSLPDSSWRGSAG